MKTSTLVLAAGAFGATLVVHPPAAHPQTPQPTVQLTWVDRAGKAIETVGPAGAYRGPDLASDGKRLAVHRHDDGPTPPGSAGSGDVFVFESGQGPGRRLTPAGPELVDNAMPIWSPDGTRIAFGSMRNGKGGIYLRRADGTGGEELLIESETTKMPMSWSPDGRYIVYWSPGDIQWVLPLFGDRTPFQLSSGSTTHAQISPEGKWIVYQDTSAESQIVVRAFPKGSTVVQVAKNGVLPRWRGDGKELFYLSQWQNGQLMAADITVTGSRIVAGAPHALFDSGYVNMGHPGGNYHVFAVSRDGQRFLIPRPDSTPENANTRTLTLVDRQGTATGTVGERGLYNGLEFSPDRMRLALLRNDPAKGTADVWVVDIATGRGAPLTSVARGTSLSPPVWSPDGQWIAYIAQRDGVSAIYRKRSNGEGAEEIVSTLNAATTNLLEWTDDGQYLTFYSAQLGGNIVFAVPLSGERKPIELARAQFPMIHARLSPDNRFLAYRSNESGKDQVWVRRTELSGPATDKWQVSIDGGTGPVYWRGDGKEVVYLSLDRGMMSVDVRVEADVIMFDPPKQLFTVPDSFPAGAGIGGAVSMTRDGERFALAVPRAAVPVTAAPQPPQIALLDRQGKPIQHIGEPGRWQNPRFSPDGSRVLVRKAAQTGPAAELWSIDVATGKGTLVATGQQLFSALWSRDGRQVFYVGSRPGGLAVIMRKAADGSGAEEAIFQYTPGAPINLTDITPDGRYLAFDSGGVLLLVPTMAGAAGAREATEYLREEYFAGGARFSPDGRAVAYFSDETDRIELYLRPFDPVSGRIGPKARQVSSDGASGGLVWWGADGKELFYMRGDQTGMLMMAAAVSTTPTPTAGAPKFLFGTRGPTSGDGQRFLVVMPR